MATRIHNNHYWIGSLDCSPIGRDAAKQHGIIPPLACIIAMML